MGRHQQIIKRQVNNAITKILQEEREVLRNMLEQMVEKEKEERPSLILALSKLAGKKSPSKPDVQSTQDNTERNNIEGMNEIMI